MLARRKLRVKGSETMWTPHRTLASCVAGLALAGLGGCAVYPLPYAAPYPSPASNVNTMDPARAGQAVYAPVYGAYGGMARVDGHGDAGYTNGGYAAPVHSSGGYGQPHPFPADQAGYGNPDGYGQGAYRQGAYGQGTYGQAAYSESQGQVVDVRTVHYRGNPAAGSAAGTAVGGVLGGAIANANSGRWNRGGNTLAGVIAGALIGSAIGTAASYQSSAVAYRVTARMDSGAMRTIDYRSPPQVRIGDRINFDGQQFYR